MGVTSGDTVVDGERGPRGIWVCAGVGGAESDMSTATLEVSDRSSKSKSN